MLYFEQSLMQLLWQHFMASLLYPKVFFDSWIIGPVRNSSTSFGVGLLRIYAESCDVSVSENKEKLTLVILLTDDIVLRNWWSTMLLFFSFSWNSTKSRKQWRKLKMVENLKSCTSHERRCFHITFSFSFWLLEYLWFCNQWDHGTTCENNDCQECFWYVLCFYVMFFIQKHFCHVFEWQHWLQKPESDRSRRANTYIYGHTQAYCCELVARSA